METIVKNASVKVMLSHDYCHFETSMSLENESGVTLKDIDDARKNCNRLMDKAIAQYKIAKKMAQDRTDGKFKIQNFTNACEKIKMKAEGERTINEMAMLKQYDDENWQDQFENDWDYDDGAEHDELPF